ncbi:ABC transporter substrate-binding protein [Salibacterium aidingense]|uniref:ABC transporter substrate-binding protein n=1 Tax=Salibacterium aidingense TaxID=384933 RepID=UPI0003F946FB|nr:sugar ABC transporter substrate-binding protein [Salibacterium aidingense]
MKKILFTGIISMVGLTLMACSGSGSSEGSSSDDGKEEITVWTWPNNDQTFENITIPMFEEEHPDINVKVEAFGSEEYPQKLRTSLTAGEGPDVAMVEIANVSDFREMGTFENLNQEPYNAAELKADYVDYTWEYVEGDDGSVFALPKNTAPAAMFYNKKAFSEAGLPTDPDEVHELMKTWDDYVEAAGELSTSGEKWAISTPNQVKDTIIQQNGTPYYDEEGNLQINNETFMDAYDYVEQLDEMDAFSPYVEFSSEWNGAIQNGSVATYFHGNWFEAYLKNNSPEGEGNWGVTYAPEYKGQSAFNDGGDFIGIVKDSEKKETGWEFVQFVSQNSENLEKMYTQDALYPAYEEALSNEWMNQENEFFGGQVTNEIFAEVADNMEAPSISVNDPVAESGVNDLLSNITESDRSLNEALEQAVSEIEARQE